MKRLKLFTTTTLFLVLGNAAFAQVSLTPATTLLNNKTTLDWYGESVSSAGDVNGDGYDDVIVGSPLYGSTSTQTQEGKFFVHHGSATGVSTTPSVQIESNRSGAQMGWSVSSGDINGDTYDDIIVGVPFYSSTGSLGAFYVYYGSATGISTSPVIRTGSGYMGWSLSTGDVNGDGYDDIVAGGYGYADASGSQTNEGCVRIYLGSASGVNSGYTMQEGNLANAYLGWSVSTGDINSDGYDDLIAGAKDYTSSTAHNVEGAVYIYLGSNSGIPSNTTPTILEGNYNGARLGTSVGVGDFNNDGYDDVVGGASPYSNTPNYEGAAYVYYSSSTGIASTATPIIMESNMPNAQMGHSVNSADFNNDGYDDLLLGARIYSNGESVEGATYVHYGSTGGLSNTADLIIETNKASSQFGTSAASAGDVNGDGYDDAIVGARYYTGSSGERGAAFIFHGSTSGLAPECGANALPTTADTTYTGAYKNTDANGWTHYCSSDDKLLLSLDTTGSGAVVAVNDVQLKLGADKTTSHGAAGGMILNNDGYILIDRMWDVSPTTQPSTGDVGVRYYFTAAEYSAFVTAAAAHKNASNVAKPTTINAVTDMEFYKNTSGAAFDMPHTASGVLLANGSAASTTSWVYAAKGSDHSSEFKVSSFSGGGAGAGANSLPLPVELLSFTAAQADQHTAMLRWTTATEINNNRFDIERSYDGRTFEVVGDVAGNGNSQHQIDYSYSDASVSKVQNTVYYRLKQVDFDGSTEYSDIRVVRFDAVGNDMQLVAYPNPLNNELNVMVGLSNGESYQLEVTNLQGALVHQENHTYDNGMHKLNTSEWNSGMYKLSVATKHATKHMKIVKK